MDTFFLYLDNVVLFHLKLFLQFPFLPANDRHFVLMDVCIHESENSNITSQCTRKPKWPPSTEEVLVDSKWGAVSFLLQS